MDTPDRWAVYAVIGVLLLAPVLSGPLVGAVDLSVDRPSPGYTPDENLGDGRVNLTVLGMPDRVSLVRGDYGNDAYRLRIPPAVVDLRDVRGHPILTYKIRIEGLDFIRISPSFLSPSDGGRLELTIDGSEYAPERINGSVEYTARLKLLKRENGTKTVLRNATVPIEVVE